MSDGWTTWFEAANEYTDEQGLPRFTDMPTVEAPEDRPPDIHRDITELTDNEVARYLERWTQWHAWSEDASARYSAATDALGSMLSDKRREVYIREWVDKDVRPKNQREADLVVENDPEVTALRERYNGVKQGDTAAKGKTRAYSTMKMLYVMERKARSEQWQRQMPEEPDIPDTGEKKEWWQQ